MSSEKGYRTLMLEPQWHPIRGIRQRTKRDFAVFLIFCIFWDWVVPLVVSLPYPMSMALWPWWRWILFGLGTAPLIALILVLCIRCLRAVWRHPPFKVKTRYLSRSSAKSTTIT